MTDTNGNEFRPKNFNSNSLMLYFFEIYLATPHFRGEICQILTPSCQLRQIYANLYSIGARVSMQILSLHNHTNVEFFDPLTKALHLLSKVIIIEVSRGLK